MKVKELIAKLKEYDPELIVLAAKDDEGNGYHHLNTSPAKAYTPELDHGWIDEMIYEQDFEHYIDEDPEIKVNCIVL